MNLRCAGRWRVDRDRHHFADAQVDVEFGKIQSSVAEELPDEFENAGGDELVDVGTQKSQIQMQYLIADYKGEG